MRAGAPVEVLGWAGRCDVALQQSVYRPKAIVQEGDGLWIAKFNRGDDRWNNTRVEHAMLRLARECGT
jgi:hypothetical protein